ncbi:ketosteroid isomerase [Pelomonas sp. Root1217]|uniref:nuclear transport factor 2 family protein n=1 Tax=Pelomonas sp. Root1217 TaxID=1736430 RepID=UPI00070CC102|nr:nuclear transport factor 2 family protein [Pelomonas sp. Root1217]KQV49302.1 ketosteroid isomerase [Pelomonas sp. Root1217]
MKSNLQIVSDHYAASARGDVLAMMADMAPDVAWTEMAGFPCAGTWIGPAAVVSNVFAVLGRDWDDYRFTLEQLIDGGEQLVALGHYSGRHRATDKDLHARVAHVWRLKAGRVVAFEQFTDTLLVARAMTA